MKEESSRPANAAALWIVGLILGLVLKFMRTSYSSSEPKGSDSVEAAAERVEPASHRPDGGTRLRPVQGLVRVALWWRLRGKLLYSVLGLIPIRFQQATGSPSRSMEDQFEHGLQANWADVAGVLDNARSGSLPRQGGHHPAQCVAASLDRYLRGRTSKERISVTMRL